MFGSSLTAFVVSAVSECEILWAGNGWFSPKPLVWPGALLVCVVDPSWSGNPLLLGGIGWIVLGVLVRKFRKSFSVISERVVKMSS